MIFKGTLIKRGLTRNKRFWSDQNLKDVYDTLSEKTRILLGTRLVQVDGFQRQHIQDGESIGSIVSKDLKDDKVIIRFTVKPEFESHIQNLLSHVRLSVGAVSDKLEEKHGIQYFDGVKTDHVSLVLENEAGCPDCKITEEAETK